MAASTPKAVLHQKYGSKAVYKIEELKESIGNGCPGLAIPQQVRTLYRCSLELPEFSVTSDTFTKKKDAEQSAAKMAIEKLGIHPKSTNLSVQESWDELIARISYLFSDEFLSSSHPLVGHFKESFNRESKNCGRLPVSVLPACDSKLVNLCKSINPMADSRPASLLALVMKAAIFSDSISVSERKLWICKKNPYYPEVIQRLVNDNANSTGTIILGALYIPSSSGKPIEKLTMEIAPKIYYMDVIAQRLGVEDCSQLLISRNIGKSTSEMRFYYPVSGKTQLASYLSKEETILDASASINSQLDFNARASYLSGQMIFGDAIMASIGYTWRSVNLIYEDISLGTYYRMLVGRTPDGNYKVSRDALLAAELPTSFTTRSNWRGMLPRDLLSAFCRHHKLLEPVFCTKCLLPLESSPERIGKSEQIKSVRKSGCSDIGATGTCHGEFCEHGSFWCEVKIFSKMRDALIESTTKSAHRKQSDAIHSVALQVLSWLAVYFKDLEMPVNMLSASGEAYGVKVHAENLYREFGLCRTVLGGQQEDILRQCCLLERPNIMQEDETTLVEDLDTGVFPSTGSLVSVSYSITLFQECDCNVRECLETKDDYEFEVGCGAAFYPLEAYVTQLSVNQTARFITKVPNKNLILAVAGESAKPIFRLSIQDCMLEYFVKLLRVSEPLEDRIEQALFNPPLSKQRVDYALRHIHDSHAASLVDFGCGSGSLLLALLEHPTSLEKIVGVDLSQKGLSRAAKILHSKLSKNQHSTKSTCIKYAVLYDGSITDFDSRLCGFDIGTCLEVIEHMEENQAHLFGDVVLSFFCPRILIVSTPNYEYNSILQGTSISNNEEDPEDKAPSLQFKFRNHDHKFEWTREQFENWASHLALKHNYSVEFGGVGGVVDVEPGFASQIAVFRSKILYMTERGIQNENSFHTYKVIWEWPDVRSI